MLFTWHFSPFAAVRAVLVRHWLKAVTIMVDSDREANKKVERTAGAAAHFVVRQQEPRHGQRSYWHRKDRTKGTAFRRRLNTNTFS